MAASFVFPLFAYYLLFHLVGELLGFVSAYISHLVGSMVGFVLLIFHVCFWTFLLMRGDRSLASLTRWLLQQM